MATESLHVDMDAYLKAQALSSLGMGSSYSTLQVRSAYATVIRDVKDWEGWTLPAVVIVGNTVQHKAPAHMGGGVLAEDNTYAYVMAGIVSGGEEVAYANAKTLATRIRLMLRTLDFAVTANGGEHPRRPILNQTEILLYRKPSTTGDQFYGVCFVGFSFRSSGG